jgi:DNA polymerase/3'-5' exonuclease PolX
MELKQAIQIAENCVEQLSPYCERIAIAGSIRRKRPEVKDIEIVCIPKRIQVESLFGEEFITDPEFCWTVNLWEKIKGSPEGRYTQRRIPGGINLDLFMCFKENWGNIFAIRTGSAEYSHKVLAAGWVKKGYISIDGFLHQGVTRINIYEEEDLFRLLDIRWIEPEKREI